MGPLVHLFRATLGHRDPLIQDANQCCAARRQDPEQFGVRQIPTRFSDHQIHEIVRIGQGAPVPRVNTHRTVHIARRDVCPGPGHVACVCVQAMHKILIPCAQLRSQCAIPAAQMHHEPPLDTGAFEQFCDRLSPNQVRRDQD